MGVPGLWDILNKAGQSRALTHIAVIDGFERNKSGKCAYRVGIDASIWYHHASFGKGGENAEVRTLFFRLKSLAQLPILPLFMFDGRERPRVKRGSRLGKSGSHALAEDMRTMLNAFGMEWRTARGEAEAELAYLNQKGHIDAILTDDCDALIFGGRTLIKNSSLSLTGNKSKPAVDASGKASKHHVMMYTVEAIQLEVGISRGGLVLFALLSGGDYHKGVDKFGKVIAHALARCEFGDQLLEAYKERAVRDIHIFLAHWRTAVNAELRTNSRGYLPHRSSLSLPDNFPDLQILDKYTYPVNSSRAGTSGGGAMRDKGELDLKRLVEFCEEKFEWGYRSAIIKRFRSLIWHAAVIHVLRRAALVADEREKTRRIESGIHDLLIRSPLKPSQAEAVGTPASLVKQHLAGDNSSKYSEDRYAAAFVNGEQQPRPLLKSDNAEPHPLIIKVVGMRHHISTDRILEYRVEVSPVQLVSLASASIKGKRAEPSAMSAASMEDEFNDISHGERPKNGTKKPPPHPDSSMRIWVPGSMLHQVHPGLVEDYTIGEEARKTKKTTKKGTAEVVNDDDHHHSDTQQSSLERQHSRRQPDNPAAMELAYQDNSPRLDPWFMSDGVVSPISTTEFLFAFPDPESHGNKNPPHDDSENILVDNSVPKDSLPLRSEAGFSDRSLGASNKKKRGKNLVSDTLAKLDKLASGRVTKRQKITHVDIAGVSVGCPSYQPFPIMPILNGSEEASPNSLARPLRQASVPLRRTALHPCVYPEPSSSQESRLSSETDDFVDLT